MRPDTLAFISVSLVTILTPGLDMTLIARNGMAGGLPAALRTSAGVMLGGSVHALAAIIGLSAILATSATAFSVVRIVGGIYLLYVGIQSFAKLDPPIQILSLRSRRLPHPTDRSSPGSPRIC
jgi:threonine/homoserine/homoserine lactone efflux protein